MYESAKEDRMEQIAVMNPVLVLGAFVIGMIALRALVKLAFG